MPPWPTSNTRSSSSGQCRPCRSHGHRRRQRRHRDDALISHRARFQPLRVGYLSGMMNPLTPFMGELELRELHPVDTIDRLDHTGLDQFQAEALEVELDELY